MPEIIAAFEMFDGGIHLGALPKRSRVEESDNDTSDDDTFELNLNERLKKNNKEFISLNSRLASLTKELFEILQIPIFDEEGLGGGDEEPVGGVGEQAFNEEGLGGGNDECVGGFQEEVGGGVEEDLTGAVNGEGARNYVQDTIEINDDVDHNAQGQAPKPLVVVPLRAIAGDPRSSVNIDQLYIAASRRDRERRIVCEIIGQTLSTKSIYNLAPYQYVYNMLVLFATTVLMHIEKRRTGVMKRILFSSLYADLIIDDYLRMAKNRRVFTLYDYRSCLRAGYFGLEDIAMADFLFLQFCHDEHWWCYAVKLRTLEIYVIDSLVKAVRNRKRIDTAVAQNLARFFYILNNRPEDSIGPLSVVQANIPTQPNLHDCGVIMLQAMQIWDGEDKFNGKSMPQYSNEELLAIRKQYVGDWILDQDNIRIMDALEEYGLL